MWKNKIIAESDQTDFLENNYYFPKESVHFEYLKKSGNTYTCPWKGVCDFYDVMVDGEINHDAAWIYSQPKEAAFQIAGKVAFWKGVQIIK